MSVKLKTEIRPTATASTSRIGIFITLVFIAGLIGYKWNAAFSAIQRVSASGVLRTRTEVVAFDGATVLAAAERSLNYFSVIWPALAFGVLISAAVRAFVSPEWFAQLVSGKVRSHVAGGVAGAPLMLCSCCVAPVFTAMYERSSRLGPSLALMLAAPSLNPAALILTFMLFAPKIAVARLMMALLAVFLAGSLIERVFETRSIPSFPKTPSVTFFRSLIDVTVRTVPALAVGVLCSMLLAEFIPQDLLASGNFRFVAVVAAATIAVPLALPTFFEIPLALGLLAAGAPAGAAAAFLFAASAINLPSLLALAKATSWKVAASLAGFIWAVAVTGGLLIAA